MIIGAGLLASAFAEEFSKKSDTVIFASGVSNSQERNVSAFVREKSLLERVLTGEERIVYFSTCSLYDPELRDTPYIQHKHEMEELVRRSPNFVIFRLPQVIGKTSNTKTLGNFIYNNIIEETCFDVWRYAKRNIIDVSDVVLIAKYILSEDKETKQVVNIANPVNISMIELVQTFEFVLEKKAVYTIQDTGSSCEIDTDFSSFIASQAGIIFDDSYVERLIRKYYCMGELTQNGEE